MRPPSIRLTNRGHPNQPAGRETVTIYQNRTASPTDPQSIQDDEGNWIKTPLDATKATYPAVITPALASMTEGDGTTESTSSYQILIYSSSDPLVAVDDSITWHAPNAADRVLVAAGQSARRGPGSWGVSAVEVDPNASGGVVPVGLESS